MSSFSAPLISPGQNQAVAWEISVSNLISTPSIHGLFNNKIGLIAIKNFLSDEFRFRILEELRVIGFNGYENNQVDVAKICASQFERMYQKHEYFNDISNCRMPVLRSYNEFVFALHNLFELNGFRLNVAFDCEEGKYLLPAVARLMISGVLLHRDYAPVEALKWTIGRLSQQLAFVAYLNDFTGGCVTIYPREWEPLDDITYKSKGYSFDMAAVGSIPGLTYQPEPGDLVLFNTKNFHLVHPSTERITLGGFIGREPDSNTLEHWA